MLGCAVKIWVSHFKCHGLKPVGIKGEPMSTPWQAFKRFNKSGMDTLVLGNYVTEKSTSQ
ncbi:MAG: hypothetical protein A2W33_09355 [Chloroflexi bacterium RBG_16_52_11]|nr:MAG: hypothetical protein A2W33_09355 [Chloroflexi bacterium RBG_16_52_11]